jgi:hypothetical protein
VKGLKHYLVIVLPLGKDEVRRVYWPLASMDETAEAALDRWIAQHPKLKSRKSRGKLYDAAERSLRGSILYVRIARPSSWWREQAESEGLTYPAPVGRARTRRR